MTELAVWKRRTVGFSLLVLLLTIWAARLRSQSLALFLVQAQDIPVLLVLAVAMLLTAFWRPALPLPRRSPPVRGLLAGGVMISALLAWGTYALMGNLALSRDEHMVLFDMRVFDTGRLAMPIAPEWRSFALALVPRFLLNPNNPTGLVSNYLPMNAVLRLAFSKLADPAWYNPLLVLVGGLALLDISKRAFSDNPRAIWAVLLVYFLSSEVLITAMTPFSMTGHLALNLIWLAAFLRGGKLWNSVAILTGFVATGLHQLVFHPFFAAPFLLWKLRERQWKLVLLYVAAYALIVLWWACYPIVVSPEVVQPGRGSAGNLVADKLIPLLLNRDPRALPLMMLNLMRFAAWQNLALWPLCVAAVPVAIRERGLARALFLGILAWLAFIAILLPDQGRGWGYRYLDGYEGSFALLAGAGYRELEKRIGREADGLVVLLTGITAVIAMPVLLASTSRLMRPHIALEHLISSQSSAFVVIDDTPARSIDGRWADSSLDHVRNWPDLTNRPLRFSAEDLDPHLLAELCQRGTVALVTRSDMHRVGYILNVPSRSPDFEKLLSANSNRAGCYKTSRQRQ